MAAEILSVDVLRRLLALDHNTGRLAWRPRPADMFPDQSSCNAWNGRHSGKPAIDTVGSDGYRRGTLLYRSIIAHRVVWALAHGSWPKGHIDHINGDKSDNRPSNLRDVSHMENSRNKAMQRRNTSGVQGVMWSKQIRKWQAMITANGKRIYLGSFDDIASAAAVRKAAEAKYGFHENHGRAA